MGPWYLDEAKTRDFPSFPSNTATVYRIPKTQTDFNGSHDSTTSGTIGYFVDGVALFDSRTHSHTLTAMALMQVQQVEEGVMVFGTEMHMSMRA